MLNLQFDAGDSLWRQAFCEHAKRHWSIYVIGTLYFLTRLPLLNSDLPPYSVLLYQPIDEAYYALPSYEWLLTLRAGWEHYPINLFQNFVLYPLLAILGPSYVGMRSSSVAFGLGVFLISYLVLVDRVKIGGTLSILQRNLVYLVCASFLVFNYAFLYATVVVEPTIAIIFYGVALVYLLTHCTERHYGLWGAALAFGPLFVYPQTLYMVLGALTAIVLTDVKALHWRNIGKTLVGALIVCAAYGLIVLVLYPNVWTEFTNNLRYFTAGRVIDPRPYPVWYLAKNFLKTIVGINFFAYSSAMLTGGIAALIAIVGFVLWRKRRVDLFLACIVLMLFARLGQLFFESSYFQRKGVDVSFIVFLLMLEAGVVLLQITTPLMRNVFRRGTSVAWAALLAATTAGLATHTSASLLIASFKALPGDANYRTLSDISRRYAGCDAIGEWSHGFNVFGTFKTRLNSYRFLREDSYRAYSEQLLQTLKETHGIVISSYPKMTRKVSPDVRAQLTPIEIFDFNDGGATVSQYAVYRLASDASVSSGAKTCGK
ncbi:hypothetical protein [Pandoraea sp. CB10b_02]|uniref:hypothetical protein n=1 Tax=Pandoraea sp. CB10b_02 TaxID=2014535 RepID=UPI0025799E8A|nr:hypothetical protein [Pandoraea sp. CB10b_02]